MDKETWIADRLPTGHGFSSDKITEVLADPEGADGVKELALADLLEQLASQDRYKTVSIGNTSYSDPILMERARIWRGRAPIVATADAGLSTFSFIPIMGRTPAKYDEYGAGAEIEL